MKSDYTDFFKVKGEYSIRNLMIFVGVAIGGLVVIYMALQDTLEEGIFGIFMLATGGVYGYGKLQDSKETIAQINADAPAQPVADINVENIENTENLTKEGNVNIGSKKVKK